MILETGRFGQLTIRENEIINFTHGILGFMEYTKYCLVDPGDDTLVMWLQSLENPHLAFPVIEPKIFKGNYAVRLSGAEHRELQLESVNTAAVYTILTIPENISQMTTNLKAPIVINVKEQIAKQVVLQENEYSIRHPIFNDLRAHLMTIQSQLKSKPTEQQDVQSAFPISVKSIPPTDVVSSLNQ